SRPPAPARPRPDGLPLRRDDAAFEALRDRADAMAEPPRVYLACLGPLAEHLARADFAANLLAAGGVRTVRGAGADGFAQSGAAMACVCGSDDRYKSEPEPMARALREAGARRVLLAGRPPHGGA